MPDMKQLDMELTDQVTWHAISKHENGGQEIALPQKYPPQTDYITIQSNTKTLHKQLKSDDDPSKS